MNKSMAAAAAIVVVAAAFLLRPRESEPGDRAAPSPSRAAAPAAPSGRPRPVEASDAVPVSVPSTDSSAPTDAPLIRVVERDGDAVVPVAGACVRVASSTRSWEGVADARGEARPPSDLRGVPVCVWARAAGRSLVRVPAVEMDAAPLCIELPRGARVRLSFRTSAGQEIPAKDARARLEGAGAAAVRVVEVAATASEPWNGPLSPLRCGPDAWQTDEPIEWTQDGARLSCRLAPGRRRLVVVRSGAPPFVSAPFDVSGEEDVVVRVEIPDAAPPRRVQFVDALDGRALAGAELRSWLCLVKDFAYVHGPGARADADGFADLPPPTTPATPGRTTWSVVTPTHAGEFDDALLASRPERPLVVKVFAAATIEGVAYASPGEPGEGSVVSWTSHGRAVRALCGADGRFRLEGVALRRAAAEPVPVSVSRAEATRFFAVDAVAGGTASVVLGTSDRSARVGRVVGRVTAGGRGLGGLHVVLSPTEAHRTLFVRASASDGTFEFPAVPEGPARIRVVCGDPRVSETFRVATTTPFQVVVGETVRLDFDLPDAAFRVVVVAADGSPVAGARVTAKPLDARGEESRFPGAAYAPGWSAFTDARGEALLPGVVPVAPHRVEAADDGGRTARVDDALPGTTASPAEVRLSLAR